MIFPDGCDSLLTFPPSSESVNSIVSNREHSIVAIATNESLYFYYSDTRLLACAVHRDHDEITERGLFIKIYWKPDSTAICVTTTNNFLSIYSVELLKNQTTFNLHDPTGITSEFARESSEFFIDNKPQIYVDLRVVAKLEARPTCVFSFNQELILCLTDGWLHRLNWAGTVLQELSFNVRSSNNDEKQNLLSKGDFLQNPILFVSHLSPFLGGICAVFNNGSAALLISNNQNFRVDSINFLWAIGLNDACCCSTNSKFRVIYFGCKNGDIAGYSMEDLNGTLVQLFRIHLTVKNGTEFVDRFSNVRQINCLTQHGTAFSVIWNCKKLENQESTDRVENTPKNDGERIYVNKTTKKAIINCHKKICPPLLAIFSPFGEQWWCSLEDIALQESLSRNPSFYTTMDWSLDGFQLWLGTENSGVQLINLVKSVPSLHDHLLIYGADRVFLCPNENADMSKTTGAPHLVWQMFKLPNNYVKTNLPIKHVSMDSRFFKILVIGGSHGFCFYNFKTTKWRLFRKEAQEKSLFLTGGLAVFDNFIICSACNTEERDGDHLYSFNVDNQLDLDLAYSISTDRVLQIKLCGLYLLTYDVNSVVSIYFLTDTENNQLKKVGFELECIAEIRIAEFMPHPNCLISMELAKLNFHFDSVPFCGDLDSLLINTSGHLLLLSPMQPQINGQAEKNGNNIYEFQLHPPTLVASFVEEFWIMHAINRVKNGIEPVNISNRIPYLSETLWINAGCKKNRIWLPLSINSESENSEVEKNKRKRTLTQQNSRSFISRRIMLPISLDIYPLFIDGNYLACGANCTSTQYKTRGKLVSDNVSLTSKFTEDDDSLNDFNGLECEDGFTAQLSIHTLVRTNEVFIHKLLKELLKRNLGAYAFELASACRSLSYFEHILELLLHDVLDEEATCSEPIPDPLLPTVVTFLREFPDEYLQTLVHCVRKTELAFWNLLFSVSNHPRHLFQMCLQEGQLETATSCLIIMHSLVNIRESSKLAFQLLDEALIKRRWNIAKDIVRFMQNIDQASEHDSIDIDNPVENTIQEKLSSFSHQHAVPGFVSPTDQLNFPLFSSQIDIAESASRRRSGSGKKLSDFTQPRHIAAFTNTRKKSKSVSTATTTLTSSPPSKEVKAIYVNDQSKQDQSHKLNVPDANFICLQDIFMKHASNLLEDYALQDLGAFSSYLSFDLVEFFRKTENAFLIKTEDFPLVLMKLHAQFNWPYPISIEDHLPTKDRNTIIRVSQSNGDIQKMPSFQSIVNMDQLNNSDSQSINSTMSNSTISCLDSPSDGMLQMNAQLKSIAPTDWKGFHNLLNHFSEQPIKVDEQTDAELSFLTTQLQMAEAFEWLYLLSILRRNIHFLNEKILTVMRNMSDDGRRFQMFLNRISNGTKELLNWAQTRCPAYTSVLRSFERIVSEQLCDK